MSVKVKVTFASDRTIEAEAMNTDELGEIIDRTIKKFFPDTTWANQDF